MSFENILGQDIAKEVLLRALASGRLHHAYRFEGPNGVGKERMAFALAQALVCTENGDVIGKAGCGNCSACHRAVTFSSAAPEAPLHPDVWVVERGLYPAATLGRSRDETQDISVDQVRTVVLSRLRFAPHEARARLIVIRRAEELSVSAANALLKTLEEPPPATHFILLTHRGHELLDTIRSRTELLRFAPLTSAALRAILKVHNVPEALHPSAIDLSAGSAATALQAADSQASEERKAFVQAVVAAVEAPDLTAALALAQAREKDKRQLYERLEALAAALAAQSRQGFSTPTGSPDASNAASGAIDPRVALCAAYRFQEVLRAMRELERNVSPALLLETMISRMRNIPLCGLFARALRPLCSPRSTSFRLVAIPSRLQRPAPRCVVKG